MRIAHLLPGTGSFHCGSCLRDQALLRALRARGHDVVVVPMYLPTFPADPSLADAPVQMGALNLYLQQKLPVLGRLPRWLHDRLDSPRLLRWLSRRDGTTDPAFLGDMTVAMLQGDAGPFAAEIDKLVEWFDGEQPFDVVCLSNVMLSSVGRRLKQKGMALCCTLQGEAPFLDGLPEPQRQTAWRLLAVDAAEIDAFVAVSRSYRDRMVERLGLPVDRVHVIHNGLALDGAPELHLSPTDTAATLGYLARMCADKGLTRIVDAFIRLRARFPDLRLRIAGVARPEDQARIAEQRSKLQQAGLGAAVEFLTNFDDRDKRDFLRSLTVFSVPADDDESFGLYVLEAMAAAVPVVQPNHAAFPELLADGGGLLYEPDDPAALAAAIGALLADPDGARTLGEQGQRIVRQRFTIERAAREVESVLESIAPQAKRKMA